MAELGEELRRERVRRNLTFKENNLFRGYRRWQL